jgi:hypothetical protein
VPAVMVSHESVTALLRLTLLGPVLARAAADWLNRRTARAYHRVICTTSWAAAEFERIGADGVVRVPLGVDLATFRPGGGQVWSRYAGQGQILLVHAGRLSAEKKPQRSLATLATLRAGGMPVRLVVAGDGPLRSRLARRAGRGGLPVTFAGFLPGRADLAALLASADVAIARACGDLRAGRTGGAGLRDPGGGERGIRAVRGGGRGRRRRAGRGPRGRDTRRAGPAGSGPAGGRPGPRRAVRLGHERARLPGRPRGTRS